MAAELCNRIRDVSPHRVHAPFVRTAMSFGLKPCQVVGARRAQIGLELRPHRLRAYARQAVTIGRAEEAREVDVAQSS